MIKQVLGFGIRLMAALLVVFAVHLFVLSTLNYNLFDNKIIATYAVNFMLAIFIYALLFGLKKKYEHILGFVFMGGSFVKFAVYFIFFYPYFKIDFVIDGNEAASFLIPYATCLIIETFYLIKLLNKGS
jgi:hypothetical protein